MKDKNYKIIKLADSTWLNLSIRKQTTLIQFETTHVYCKSTGYANTLQINIAPTTTLTFILAHNLQNWVQKKGQRRVI